MVVMRRTISSILLSLVCGASASDVLAQGFKGAKLRASLEDTAADFWIYDDLKAAEKQAKKEAKPLLISFRCVP